MKKITWIGGAFGLLLAAGMALAQNTTFFQSLTGNEVLEAASNAGGSSAYVGVNTIRNTQGLSLNGTQTGVVQLTTAQTRYIINSQPASALTLTLPASPVPDGQIQEIINGTTSAFAVQAITITPASGQTLVGGNVSATTLAAKSSIEFRYSLSNNTWYQVR